MNPRKNTAGSGVGAPHDSATTVYDPAEVCTLLGIGDDKLRDLVANGRLRRLQYTNRWRFWGAELIRFCEEASR